MNYSRKVVYCNKNYLEKLSHALLLRNKWYFGDFTISSLMSRIFKQNFVEHYERNFLSYTLSESWGGAGVSGFFIGITYRFKKSEGRPTRYS